MSTQFKPIQIPPGVVATPTKAMGSSNWAKVNLVRWREQRLMPVGGQLKYTYPIPMASRAKMIRGWYGLDGTYRIAYLCEQNLYVDVGGLGNSLIDITPAGGMTPLPMLLTGGYGHGLYSGNYAYGSPPTAPPSSVMVTSVPDAFSLDNFGSVLYAMTSPDGRLLMWDPGQGAAGWGPTIAAGGAFTTSSTTITMASANPGTVSPGMSVYNVTTSKVVGAVLTYTGTTLTLAAAAASASQGAADHLQFGNVAVAQPAASGRGPVPLGRCFVVTPERFVMIFGSYNDGTAGGPTAPERRFAWCDQENPGAWDYSNVTSQAGFLDIEPASPIITAIATRVGNLFWTGKKAYASRFLGIPYVYNCTELADATTPWSPQSVVTTSSLTIWMSEQGIFAYDGTSIAPVACPVRPWVDADIDPINVREQACMVHVENYSEVWWFFPQYGQPFNTRAIIYNYKEGWWSQAQMARSAGITASFTAHTIMVDGTLVYEHESVSSDQYSTDAALPFAETFDLNVYAGGGSRLITVKQLIPDIDSADPDAWAGASANPPYGAIANLQYRLFYRNSRSAGTLEQSMVSQMRPDGYVDFRATGRDVRLRLEVIGPSVLDFTLGQHMVDIVPRGDR